MNCTHCIAFYQDYTVWDMISKTAEKSLYCNISDRQIKFLDWSIPLQCIDNKGKTCTAKANSFNGAGREVASPIGMYMTGKYLVVVMESYVKIVDLVTLKEVVNIKDKDIIHSACEYAATKTDPTFADAIDNMIEKLLF